MAADLQAWRVHAIVVGPMAHRDRMIALFTELLGRPPEAVDGVLLWRHVDPTQIAS
jgi:hypothetical protein